jgi:hypothetical protein
MCPARQRLTPPPAIGLDARPSALEVHYRANHSKREHDRAKDRNKEPDVPVSEPQVAPFRHQGVSGPHRSRFCMSPRLRRSFLGCSVPPGTLRSPIPCSGRLPNGSGPQLTRLEPKSLLWSFRSLSHLSGVLGTTFGLYDGEPDRWLVVPLFTYLSDFGNAAVSLGNSWVIQATISSWVLSRSGIGMNGS